ncbi:MAG: ATP-binding cassette domain-containing protein [Kiritimatiellae bacterium]|nr:ATP-binding cassette domain-containing protein [Kiritimatiellia bacterium]
MLEVKNLVKTFGPLRAVDGVSFSVARGEVLGFLGPNGAGKTTTMRMITGFLPPSAGTAVINGYDILDQTILAKKQIGYLPENAPTYGDMTVTNFLRFAAELRGFHGKARNRRVDEVVEKYHLAGVRYQSVDTLSKGYNQRVCFAQAILHDPPVLIMDEPTDGLDPNQKFAVRNLIREMAAEKVIVISTHILEEVDAVCSRAIIISRGAIVANCAPAELRAMSESYGVVELVLPDADKNALAALKQLGSVARVEVSGARYSLFPADRANLLREVTALIHQQSWQPTGLRVLDGRLDDVFRKLTTGNGTGRAPDAAPETDAKQAAKTAPAAGEEN